jgi:hypothetical protein
LWLTSLFAENLLAFGHRHQVPVPPGKIEIEIEIEIEIAIGIAIAIVIANRHRIGSKRMAAMQIRLREE